MFGVRVKIFKLGKFKYAIGLLPKGFWFHIINGPSAYIASIGLWLVALSNWRWK